MSDFEKSLKIILASEGGFVDNPDDPGGATNKGITQKTYDAWVDKQNQPTLFPKSVEIIGDAEVRAIYKESYWEASSASEMVWPLNLVHFDGAVNHGVRRANVFLQQVLRVVADGRIGPITKAAIAGADSFVTAEKLLWRRMQFYSEISRIDNRRIFLAGWVNRLISLRREYTP